jgi:putative ABC transport system permease protein
MTIAAVGSVGDALQAAVVRDATKLMGGDIEASRSDRRANPDELAYLRSLGPLAEADDSNGRAIAGDNTAFLDIIAVDNNYPLVGHVDSPQLKDDQKPGTLLDNRDGVWGALVDPTALDRLGIKLGDQFQIGQTTYQARGLLNSLPDSAARGFHLGITTMISVDALAATPDARPPLPGMLTQYRYKILQPNKPVDDAVAYLEGKEQQILDHFGDAPEWKTRNPREAAGNLARFYDLFTQFLLIVGLSALLVGGVGVSNAVAAYINARQRSIATMRSLGATSNRILFHFLTQLGVLSLAGVLIGLAIGATATALFLPVLGRILNVDLPPSIHPVALLTALGFGMLVAFAFSFLPLARAQEMKPAILFRSVGTAVETGATRRGIWRPRNLVPLLVAALLIFLLAWATTRDIKLVAWYTLGVIAAFLLLRFAGILLQWLLRLVPPAANTELRNALKAVYRPGSPAPIVILSLGLGLAMLLLIVLIDNNTRSQLQGQVTRDAPSFVATDLFPDEVDDLNTLAKTPANGIARVVAAPSYSGKITTIKGRPADDYKNLGGEVDFLLADTIPMTWKAAQPAGSTVIAGQWWPADYNGPPLISLRASTAAALGMRIGDEMTFDLYNQTITAKLANIRDYQFQSMEMEFLITFSPHALDGLPGDFMAGVKAVPGDEQTVERELAKNYPDLTFIPIGDALNQAATILDQLSTAVDVVGGLAVINGLLVLAGTMAAGRAQREADAVVNKVLGATRGDVIRAFVLEYSILGAFAAILAAVLGVIGAWAISVYALQIDYAIDAGLIVLVIILTVALTIATGAATTWSALSTKPAQFLRTEA